MTRRPRDRRLAAPAGLKECLGMLLAVALLVTIFSLITRRFFSVTTFQTIANQYAEHFVVAVGMTTHTHAHTHIHTCIHIHTYIHTHTHTHTPAQSLSRW